MSQEPETKSHPPRDFNELSYYILQSLKTLSADVSDLQKSFAEFERSIVSKQDVKELRDEWQRKHDALQGKIEGHDRDLTELKVKALALSAVAGAAMSWLVKKIGG